MVTSVEKDDFLQKIYRPYIQSVIDHINARLESSDLISSMSVFDPRHLPDTEELSSYGDQKIKTLLNFYGSPQKVHFEGEDGTSQPDIEIEEAGAEWKLFRRVLFVQYKTSTLKLVLSKFIEGSDIATTFPNLAKLAMIVEVLPVTTAVVERTFSSMKIIKTRLRNRMGESTLEHTMRICIEGPTSLSSDDLEAVIDHYKQVKKRK